MLAYQIAVLLNTYVDKEEDWLASTIQFLQLQVPAKTYQDTYNWFLIPNGAIGREMIQRIATINAA